MKKVRLEQNSKEWERWREDGIGASDAPIILGDVGWNDTYGLISSKLKLSKFEYTARMKRGHDLEPLARQLYEEEHGRKMDAVCVVHDKYPWLKASLDGLSEDDQIILEIKCPSDNAHTKALNGAYPYYYKGQLQHQLLVTGCPVLHYWSYSDSKAFTKSERTALVVVYPEPEYQENLFAREKRFYKQFKKIKAKLKEKGLV